MFHFDVAGFRPYFPLISLKITVLTVSEMIFFFSRNDDSISCSNTGDDMIGEQDVVSEKEGKRTCL